MPDKDVSIKLSSMTRGLITAGIALMAAPACGQGQSDNAFRQSLAMTTNAGLAGDLQQWQSLRRSEALPFQSYARFLIAHPGWPQEATLRKSAERALSPDTGDAEYVVRYFSRFPPTSATATLRHAEALSVMGRQSEAIASARKAWTMGTLSSDDENRISQRFGSAFNSDDHDLRMERLLWHRATTGAVRQLELTSSARRAMYSARLALLTQSSDALEKAAPFANRLRTDPGFLMDQARYHKAIGQSGIARQLLAAPRQFATPPIDPERWLDMLEAMANEALNNGQPQQAYDIARQLIDIYPQNIAIRDRSLAERDSYTNLAWLAGRTALRQLGRPSDAAAMFDLYARAARSPQTQSKGLYWAGRAMEAARRSDDANRYFSQVAIFSDQFYGQLASERLQRPVVAPLAAPAIEMSSEVRAGFERRTVVKAIEYLGASGDWATQTLFIRHLADTLVTNEDHALALELGKRIGRPDLAYWVARNAGNLGLRQYVRAGFPTANVDVTDRRDWTIIHAISRQESQFDRKAVSRVGARGMMQLMPGTAAETAGRIGVSYAPSQLDDVDYNTRLGLTYFTRLLNQYEGSYPLAAAAYNAGAGNVNKWIRANGDPRVTGDIIGWIEAIPFSETRGYVQNVMQNAVVYDLINPRPGTPQTNALSYYLGKRTPG